MNTKILITAVLLTLSSSAGGADQADYEERLETAVAAQKKAASVGGEWRDIGKMLGQAGAFAEAGDYEGAIKILEVVEHQSLFGHKQMTSQAGKVGPEPYMQ